MKIKNIFILAMFCVVFSMGVFAEVDSCLPVAINGATAKYNYFDGHNNTHDAAETFYPDESLINNTIQDNIWGETGLTVLELIKYEEADGDRGMAILAQAASGVAPYRAFFQWNDEILAIPNMFISSSGNGTYYYTSSLPVNDATTSWCGVTNHSIEYVNSVVYFWNNTGALLRSVNTDFAVGADCAGGNDPIDVYYNAYKYGNDTLYFAGYDDGNLKEASTVLEGNMEDDIQALTINQLAGIFSIYLGNSSVRANNARVAIEMKVPQGANEESWIIFDSDSWYSCAGTVSNLTFYLFEGSEECSAIGSVPQTDCYLFSSNLDETCQISAGSETEYSANVTNPTIQEFTVKQEDALYLYDGSIEGRPSASCSYEENTRGENIDIYKTLATNEALHITPQFEDADLFALELAEYLDQLTGIATFEDGERVIVGTMKYTSPQDVREMNETEITFLDEPLNVDVCDNDWEYYAILGYNSTTYRVYNVDCSNGVRTTSTTYVNDVNATYYGTLGFSDAVQMLDNNCYDAITTPIELNTQDGSIDRYFLYYWDIDTFFTEDAGWNVLDSVFSIEYNYTVIVEQSCDIENIPYGEYAYSCTPLSGYFGDYSGTVTLDSSYDVIEIDLQSTKPLYIELAITNQDSAIGGIKCRGNWGYDTTNSSGVCRFRTSTDSTDTVRLSDIPNNEDVEFNVSISDYYNSDKLGENGEWNTCKTFDGIYTFSYDISKPYIALHLSGVNTQGQMIRDVQFYVDGSIIGSSDGTGKYYYKIPFDAVYHTVVGVKNGWTNGTNTFDYQDDGTIIELLMHPDTETTKIDDITTPGEDYTGLEQEIFSPFILSMIALGVLIVVGTMISGGNVSVGILLAMLGIVVFVIYGTIPVWIGILLIVLAGIGGYAVFAGLV